MLMLAFRNLFRHGFRTLLTLSVVIFGVVGLILSGGFIEDVFVQLREATIHSQLGHIQIFKDGYTKLGRREPYRYLIDPPDVLLAMVHGRSDIKRSMLRLNFAGLANNGKADLPIVGDGIEPDKEAALGSFLKIIEGERLKDADANGILLGKGVARSLHVAPGATLTILANTPDGAMNSLEFTVVGVFQSFSKDYDDRAVRIPLSAAQELLTTTGVHSLVIELNATEATDAVADTLRGQINHGMFEVKTWFELADFYQKTVDVYRQQFGVLQIIILIMVVLSVANSVNMAIHERIGEFGTLMSLGNRRQLVFRLVLIENMILGFVGSCIGVLAGVLLAWAISKVGIPMPPPPNADVGYIARIQLVPQIVAIAFAVGWSATIMAALLPARRASRLEIVDALRANL